MKIVLAGGTGQLGRILDRRLTAAGHDLIIVSRENSADDRMRRWDGRTLGPWAAEIDGAVANEPTLRRPRPIYSKSS